jgi:Flp pilus assembly pilin Flp
VSESHEPAPEPRRPSRSGPTFTEYMVMTALIVVVIIAAVTTLGDKKKTRIKSAETTYERSDRLHRAHYERLPEADLRQALVHIGSRQLQAMNDPELCVEKAIVAEYLTRWDVERGTKHWNRAAVHYAEAIERWRKIQEDPAESPVHKADAPQRIARLHVYLAKALAQDGKTDEAKAAYREAAKSLTVQGDAEDGLAELGE